MLTVLLLSAGEHGDVVRAVDLQAALQARGLQVTVQTHGRADVTLLVNHPHILRDKSLLQADQTLRDALLVGNTPYQVLYGDPTVQLARALQIIEGRAATATVQSQPVASPLQDVATPAGLTTGRTVAPGDSAARSVWVWACDKCSDPQCEHRLLSDLLQSRGIQP